MIRLFDLHNGEVTPTTEALMVPEFAAIKERDDNNRGMWKKELAYIYLMHCPCKENGYYVYDEETRREKLKKDIFGKHSDWQPDDVIFAAEKKYIDFLENIPSIKVLRTIRKSLDKIQKFLRTVDLNERTKAGNPVWKPKDITSAQKDLKDLYDKLKQLENEVYNDIEGSGRIRGGGTKGFFED